MIYHRFKQRTCHLSQNSLFSSAEAKRQGGQESSMGKKEEMSKILANYMKYFCKLAFLSISW